MLIRLLIVKYGDFKITVSNFATNKITDNALSGR